MLSYASTSLVTKRPSWTNSDNNAFYEEIKAEGLRELAVKGGLATGCDMKVLTPYWSEAQSVLEVGAGYGRVIEYLLKHQFPGKITAIERCNALFNHLEQQYESAESIDLLHADVRQFKNIDKYFDLILFLWGGISNFPPKEQSLVFEKFASLLKPNGKLILEVVPANMQPLDTKEHNGQFYTIEVYKSIINVHLPTDLEINDYARKTGFSHVSCIDYKTDIGRKKQLYILSLN